jgi:hypothetical protein
MPPTGANSAKTADSLANATRADFLHWDVFVTPGIPIVTRDRPPGVRETYFQAMASTLRACQTTTDLSGLRVAG